MKTKVYASSEERAVELLYERLGVLVLIKDKKGKPIKYVKKYPSLQQLITGCKEMKVSLPKNPKLYNVLLTMCRAGFTNIQRFPAPKDGIKSLTERALDKALKDLSSVPVARKGNKIVPPDDEIMPPKQELDKMEAEQAKREADKEATKDKE